MCWAISCFQLINNSSGWLVWQSKMRYIYIYFSSQLSGPIISIKNSLLFCLACCKVSFCLLPVSLVSTCRGMNIWPWITCLSKSIWNLVKGVSSLQTVRSHQERDCVLISSSTEMFFTLFLGCKTFHWQVLTSYGSFPYQWLIVSSEMI